MILTVALNAALDVTYHIDQSISPHSTHRVREVTAAAGGKALNTARILHTLGESVVSTGLLGGATGRQIAGLIPQGLRHSFVSVAAESRRALVVADPDDATGFWEPGADVTDAEWSGFLDRYAGLSAVARVVVLSGSLPPGLPIDAYAQLVRIARLNRATTILDCDGSALHAALPERPDVIKPNTAELAEAVPHLDTGDDAGVVDAARVLLRAGAGTVVASRGPEGLIAVTDDGHWSAAPAAAIVGNPTGAGDACVAGLARGILHGQPWPSRLRGAVALSSASVLAPIAGHVEVNDYLRLRGTVDLRDFVVNNQHVSDNTEEQ
ncbi:tagatose 6-phosphate kinase [Stackebrandtia endophytica]|uniref:Tagatose 6-phosphate kinase n=1 Tax=Stackebrandtia endophytica TaxID=1496996 RepID=A0A543AWQ2_9ACTN|nr:1-phosphofructokinase family hexose kinase [Stackebrandtia endophytica]TQL77001.1 tagatose 6-phosphate kinase [Stackebrandtia endophytica]